MSDASEAAPVPTNVRSLTDTLRRVRIAEAERSDVVVELREAERARLDMLAEELRGVFAEVPADAEQFVFAVVPGNQPRLWIDQTSFVALGRDRRTYRFLKDTRLGRTVIAESADLDEMADCVTHYVAERIVERERVLEGDWLVTRAIADGLAPESRGAPPAAGRPWRRVLAVVAAFLLGMLAGAGALLAYAWMVVQV